MGFSGGGSNILKNHTHDSGILQDGGNLRLDGITEGNLSSGSVTYSDGNNMQELSVGTVGNQLTVSAGNIPEWSATMTQLSTQQSIQTGIFTTASNTFVAVGNGMQLTLPTRTGGKALVCCNYTINNTGVNNNYVGLFDDGVANGIYQTYYGQYDNPACICGLYDLDGSVIELYVRTLGGTVRIVQSPANVAGSITAFEIS
tara:strand:+ start:345 stop:947 length:603 start_codon:yes stop_codon:yes gene_type:complete